MDMTRLACFALIGSFLIADAVIAQAPQTRPPASPTFGASAGGGVGIAIPVGRIADTATAGYTLTGLVDFSAADQPYSFRAELIHQHFDRKRTVVGSRAKNITSLGASILARTPKGGSSAFVIGGIGVYRLSNEGTKPGVNLGAGLEVPLTIFIGMADVRVHYMLTEGRPALTIPITLGARF